MVTAVRIDPRGKMPTAAPQAARAAASAKGGGANWADYLKGPERDAFLALSNEFKRFGLESLAGKIFEYVKQGFGADVIALLLQDTPEYKQRFAGNELR